VLLDLKLPHLSRLEVLQRIRANKTTRVVPVVILTSSTEEKDILESYQFGANGYMREYADFDEFMMMVKRLYEYWLIVNFPPPSDT
jgi:two-component system response regulator